MAKKNDLQACKKALHDAMVASTTQIFIAKGIAKPKALELAKAVVDCGNCYFIGNMAIAAEPKMPTK